MRYRVSAQACGITRFSVLHRGGPQGKSELCVQRNDTTSNHCRRHEAGTLHHFGDRSQGLLITPCLIKVQFSRSLVGMVVPSPVFQLVPNRLSLSWRLYENCHHSGRSSGKFWLSGEMRCTCLVLQWIHAHASVYGGGHFARLSYLTVT